MTITIDQINEQAQVFTDLADSEGLEPGSATLVGMLESVGVENAEELTETVLNRWGDLIGVITLTGIATGLALHAAQDQVEA